METLEIANYWSYLHSPNYPNNYNNLESCELQIYSASGPIRLEVAYLDLEDGYDKVLVYDGADEQSRLLAMYTGYITNATVVSSGQHLYIKYNADNAITRPGFQIRFTSGLFIIKLVTELYIYKENFTVLLYCRLC